MTLKELITCTIAERLVGFKLTAYNTPRALDAEQLDLALKHCKEITTWDKEPLMIKFTFDDGSFIPYRLIK